MSLSPVEFVDDNVPDNGLMNITVMESEEFQDRKRVRQKTVVYRTHSAVAPRSEYKHQMLKTQVPEEFWEMLHDFSMFLIVDDRHDLGRFSYYDRRGHFYRHAEAPHHPSPFHHYQVGILGLFVSQIGAVVSKAMEIKEELFAGAHRTVVDGGGGSGPPSSFRVKKERPIIDLLPSSSSSSYPSSSSSRRALPPPKKGLFDRLVDGVDSI